MQSWLVLKKKGQVNYGVEYLLNIVDHEEDGHKSLELDDELEHAPIIPARKRSRGSQPTKQR